MFKEIIIQNAWFDFSLDYGLLHLQLATPITAFILLMVVLFAMNQLLFQPVFRTLDNRQKVVETSKTRSASLRVEINKMNQEYEEQLRATQILVTQIYNENRQEAQKQKDEFLKEIRQTTEEEIEKAKASLAEELETAKAQLQNFTQNLAGMTADRLLN